MYVIKMVVEVCFGGGCIVEGSSVWYIWICWREVAAIVPRLR